MSFWCAPLINLFLKIEIQLIYDIVLVSGIQQTDSAIHKYIQICISIYLSDFSMYFIIKCFLYFIFIYLLITNIFIFFWEDCVDFLYLSLVLCFYAVLCLVTLVMFDSLKHGLCDPMDYSLPGSSVNGDSPGKKSGVGCCTLLQGIFPTQGSNACLPHCRSILYCLSL